jgi:hypothetical protein
VLSFHETFDLVEWVGGKGEYVRETRRAHRLPCTLLSETFSIQNASSAVLGNRGTQPRSGLTKARVRTSQMEMH